MNTPIEFLLKFPETTELMRELSLEELKTVELSQRDYDIGGTHVVRVKGEDFFSFESWCGRIQNVKRLRQKPIAIKKPSRQWEYLRSESLTDEQLAALGEEGWELVGFEKRGSGYDVRLYFKREK